MKKLFALIISFILIYSVGSNALAYDFEADTIIVAINANYPPFEYIENGEYKGFDIELMKYIGKQMNCNIEFVNMEFDTLLSSVQSRTVDCAISAITKNEERKMVVDFSEPYLSCKVKYIENGEETYSIESYAIAYYKGYTDSILYPVIDNALLKAYNSGFIDELAAKYNIVKTQDPEYYGMSRGYDYEYTYNADVDNGNNIDYNGTTLFNDVPSNHWAYQYIFDMSNEGILSGYGNGKFGPDDTITRAQFATIMCRAANLKINDIKDTSYVDVSITDWFANYVETARYYLSGYISNGEKYYKPNENAVREDIAVALVKLKGYDISKYNEDELKEKFKDWQSISQDARQYVYAAVKNNLITGYEDNTFRGQASITRAEAAALFWRSCQLGNDNKIFEKEILEIPSDIDALEQSSNQDTNTAYIVANNETIYATEGDCIEIPIIVEDSIGLSRPTPFDFDEILASRTPQEKKITDTKSEYIFRTKPLIKGTYRINFNYRVGDAVVKIIVEEKKPEYTYELKTLAQNIEKDDEILYTMVATENSAVYLTHSKVGDGHGSWEPKAVGKEKVIEIKKDSFSPEVILSSENIEYLGTEELSKADKARLRTYILALGYNKYDKCPYAIIEQFAGNGGTNYYLYNLYTKEFNNLERDKYHCNYVGEYWTRVFSVTSEGNIFSQLGFSFSSNSRVISTGVRSVPRPAIIDNILFLGEYYYDNRIGEWEQLDYYVPGQSRYLTSNNHSLYFADGFEKIIYIVDKNGDFEIMCSFDDIDNVDGKVINIEKMLSGGSVPLTVIDDEGTLYYLDYDYNAIRQLSKK